MGYALGMPAGKMGDLSAGSRVHGECQNGCVKRMVIHDLCILWESRQLGKAKCHQGCLWAKCHVGQRVKPDLNCFFFEGKATA